MMSYLFRHDDAIVYFNYVREERSLLGESIGYKEKAQERSAKVQISI